MSRTVKGSKGGGYDYQGHPSARTGYTPADRWWKRYGAKLDRIEGRRQATVGEKE